MLKLSNKKLLPDQKKERSQEKTRKRMITMTLMNIQLVLLLQKLELPLKVLLLQNL